MSQVTEYMKKMKLKKVPIQEKHELLKLIHEYGNPDDYSKAICILKDLDKNHNKKSNKSKKSKPKVTEESENESDKENKESKMNGECKMESNEESENDIEEEKSYKPKNTIKIESICEVCNKKLKNPFSGRHLNSKGHQKNLSKLVKEEYNESDNYEVEQKVIKSLSEDDEDEE